MERITTDDRPMEEVKTTGEGGRGCTGRAGWGGDGRLSVSERGRGGTYEEGA